MNNPKYILFVLALLLGVNARGQYNPTNPAEPGAPVTTYVLTLAADPPGAGSFNINATTSYAAGTAINLRAYTATNFSFVAWEEDGVIISTNTDFTYTMPAHNAKLIAHYQYTPSSPTEPAEPNLPAKPVYRNLYLTATPAAGGSFSVTSGNSYQVGSVVNVTANPSSNFTFVEWLMDGEPLTTGRTVSYTMVEDAEANHLVARFEYTPSNPDEPSEPPAKKVYHTVNLVADPTSGGYFNVSSGNQYEEGTKQTFTANNNQWYTFQNWTLNGEIVSTNYSFQYTIPTEDVTLVAHYTFNYNPNNPGEPAAPSANYMTVFGMTLNGALGQNIIYPVYLQNTQEMYGMTVVITFPDGFTALTDNVILSSRVAGHELSVTSLGSNAYRFDITGTTPMSGNNGKVFEVPVNIGAALTAGQSYPVTLTNGAKINTDNSKEVINTRSGYIYVEEVKEDGLYAQFSYDKLHSRVLFNNLSSDKAVGYTWDFGDGTTSTEENPLHVYASPGYYNVRLVAQGQTGTDVAEMTVLINDVNTWTVQGTFFIATNDKSVRAFDSLSELLPFLATAPITGDIRIVIRGGKSWSYVYDLTEDNVTTLTTIQQNLVSSGYTLTIQNDRTDSAPVVQFGNASNIIDADVINLFVALGRNLILDDVILRLYGVDFNPTQLDALSSQTVLSGQATAEVDFTAVSDVLTFTWSVASAPDSARDYYLEGTGNIPSMTATSGSPVEQDIVYNIVARRGNDDFYAFTHTITLKPALEGNFTDLTPTNGAQLESTTVQLNWNSIKNAVYDVYLWNSLNERPDVPVAEGITETSFVSQGFCQNEHSYMWQVVARNAVQQLESSVMTFSVKVLPDLHVISFQAQGPLEAGQLVTLEWTVRNDGRGATGTQNWTERIWLVPDVYGGTNQTKCKLLKEVNNVQALAAGEEYTTSAEVLIDETAYGSYYLLVAADMSDVNLIDWTAAGGTIVNPYAPGDSSSSYTYLYASTASSGDKLREHGETYAVGNTRSDNFFYLKVDIAMAQMDQADWDILQTAYEALGSGEGWTSTWNFDVERRTVLTLPGVSILGGHVVSLDLHANGLSGTFPVTLLSLPALRSLNLSDNALTGDIGATLAAAAGEGFPAASTLESLNIANNTFSGNIGHAAVYLPALTSLVANGNCLSEVQPMLPTTITALNLGQQTIDKAVTLDLTTETASSLFSQLPTILSYNHKSQRYENTVRLMCEDTSDGWQAFMECSAEEIAFPSVGEQNAYHGESGAPITATLVNSSLQPEGSTLGLKILFTSGDANFNGTTDVTDLQAIINFAFDDYNDKPFNFTAANLWPDMIINVQDVVLMVGKLLEIDAATATAAGVMPRTLLSQKKPAREDYAEASVYVNGGRVWVDTAKPIASFELTLLDAGVTTVTDELEELGFTVRINTVGAVTRVVGYSLFGVTLPYGQTPLCDVTRVFTTVTDAVLADIEANAIISKLTGIATGIEDETQTNDSKDIYDLSGRKIVNRESVNTGLSGLPKGIYIRNGRKVVKNR